MAAGSTLWAGESPAVGRSRQETPAVPVPTQRCLRLELCLPCSGAAFGILPLSPLLRALLPPAVLPGKTKPAGFCCIPCCRCPGPNWEWAETKGGRWNGPRAAQHICLRVKATALSFSGCLSWLLLSCQKNHRQINSFVLLGCLVGLSPAPSPQKISHAFIWRHKVFLPCRALPRAVLVIPDLQ